MPRRAGASTPTTRELIERLIDARLVTSDDDAIELAHEALARAWPRLQGWLDDDVDGQRILRHLVDTADAWDAIGRPDSELYRGARLGRALDWRSGTTIDLTPTEREFLDAGRRHAERETRRGPPCQHPSTSRRHRAAVLVLAAVGGAIVAVRQDAAADTAAVAADARRAAALALDTENIDEALLLAAEAVRLDDSPDTRASLLATLWRSPALVGSVRSGDEVYEVAASPSGEAVAVVHWDAGITFHDPSTLEQTGSLAVAAGDLEYRPDGQQLAVANRDFFQAQSVRLVDATTSDLEAVQPGGMPHGEVAAWDLAYSGDGRFVAASLDLYDGWEFDGDGDLQSTVFIWEVAAPQQPIRTIEVAGGVDAVALSPGGDRVYVRLFGPRLRVDDVSSGRVAASVGLGGILLGSGITDNAADGLEVSPDGATLAVVETDEIVLRDAESLTERARLRGHSGPVRSLQFSPDGRCWRRAWRTAPQSSGTSPTVHRATCCAATPAASTVWRSVPTGRPCTPWGSRDSSCGTSTVNGASRGAPPRSRPAR